MTVNPYLVIRLLPKHKNLNNTIATLKYIPKRNPIVDQERFIIRKMTCLFLRKNLSVNSKSLKFRALGILISVLWPLLLSKLHSKAKKLKVRHKVRVKIKPHACRRYKTWRNTFKESTNQVYSLKIQHLMKETAILGKSFQSTKQFKNPTKKPLTFKTRITRKKTCQISRKTFIFILIKII